jgi:hypothetical protein
MGAEIRQHFLALVADSVRIIQLVCGFPTLLVCRFLYQSGI